MARLTCAVSWCASHRATRAGVVEAPVVGVARFAVQDSDSSRAAHRDPVDHADDKGCRHGRVVQGGASSGVEDKGVFGAPVTVADTGVCPPLLDHARHRRGAGGSRLAPIGEA
jgi:hypothetical protein